MSKIFPPTSQNISHAVKSLSAGKPVAIPTETVYGLAADARNDAAVAEIYALKSRPQFNPLISHMRDVAMAKEYVVWNGTAEKLAAAFWPGPLTLVLPRNNKGGISLLATAGLDTVAVRMPAHPVAQALLAACGVPLAAPSANRSGRVSPTTAQHVAGEFGEALEIILDGGACEVGIESTVVDCTNPEQVSILRPGSVTENDIQSLGIAIRKAVEGKILSPGQLASHYAPSIPVRLNVTKPGADEALIAFGKDVPVGAKRVVNISEKGNVKEAAANLFAALRELDSPEFSAIAVMPVPDAGIGVAINDRLKRAAVR